MVIMKLTILMFDICRLDKLVNDPSEGNAWHADHIVPVYRGGGMSNALSLTSLFKDLIVPECLICQIDIWSGMGRGKRKISPRNPLC